MLLSGVRYIALRQRGQICTSLNDSAFFDAFLCRFEVDDPTAFTRPWKGELTMNRSAGAIYEYACHEGNYALPNLLI